MATENEEFEDAFKEFATKEEKTEVPEAPEVKIEEPEKVEETPEEKEPEKKEEPWAGLPDELLEKVKALEDEREKFRSDYLSVKGRMSKEVSQLARDKADLERRLAKPAEKPVEEDSDDELATFIKEYPEFAGPVAKMLDNRLAETQTQMKSEVDAKIAPVIASEDQRFIEKQFEELTEKFKDWDVVIADEAWQTWLAGSSERTKSLADSPYADDVVAALNLFTSTDEGKRVYSTIEKTVQPDVGKMKLERDERLKRSTSVPTKTPTTARPADMGDFENSFAEFAAESDRKRAAAR